MKNQEKPKSVYVIHASSFVDHPSIDTVILANDNVGVLNDSIDRYGQKVRHIHFHGPLDKVETISPNFKGLLKVFPKTKEEIVRASNFLKKRRCLVCPEFAVNNVEDVSFITSMGIPADLLYRLDKMEKTVVEAILEYYLHHRSLDVPVEPFHTILLSKLKRDKLHLWDLFMNFPHRYFYVDNHGIAASEFDMKVKKYLFQIDRQTGEWLKTGRKDTLDTYLKNLPTQLPNCLSCPHFHWCFTWAKYKKDTCETWKTILNRIQKASRQIEDINRQKEIESQ